MTETVPQTQGEVLAPAKPRRRKNGDGRDVVTTVHQENTMPTPAPVSQSDAFLAMIERAARDASVDIDKMERLFQMHERAAANRAKGAYLAALAEMQPNLPIVTKRGVIKTNEKNAQGQKTGNQKAQSKYALWEDINEAITPVLAGCGFSLSFRVAQPTPDRVVVTAVLGHRDGHTEETALSLPIEDSGSKNNVQGWGSSVSYGKRYTALALLNISARGEDDDGNAAGAAATISDDQVKKLQDLIKDANANAVQFMAYLSKRAGLPIAALTEIPASQFDTAVAALEAKLRAGI